MGLLACASIGHSLCVLPLLLLLVVCVCVYRCVTLLLLSPQVL